MRKILSLIFITVIGISSSFAKELEGTNLQAVKTVLEANLGVNEFEELQDQLNFLNRIERKIASYGDGISEEAKLICKLVIAKQKETAIGMDKLKKEDVQKKTSKPEKDPVKEAAAMEMFNEFKALAEANEDLSSHFYYYYKQAEFATMQYLPIGQKMEIFKNILKDYEKIEEMNPNYGENLFTLGMVMYMMPKAMGGNKEFGLEKILKASKVSATKYERVSALALYSQIMFEEKKYEEAKNYLAMAHQQVPLNKSFEKIQEMNDAGYSFFKMEEYSKKVKKSEKE